MITRSGRHYRSELLTVVALAAVSAAGVLIAYEASVVRSEKFQELADNAALAGVDALLRTEGLPEAVRIEAARAAATSIVAAKEPATTVLAPVTDGMTMSVTLTRNATGKGSAVTSKARYVEPGKSVTDEPRELPARTLLSPVRG